MYEAGGGFQTNDYFLSFGSNTGISMAPGDTLDVPVNFVNANSPSGDELSFNVVEDLVDHLAATSAPTMTLTPDPTTLTGLGGGLVNVQGDATLRLTLAADAAPGWYAVDFQYNSAPVVHSVRFYLLVTNPSNPSVDEWVTALCYATFRITAIDSNSVSGRAVTGCQPLDQAVTGWTSRLLPWDE